MALIIHCDRCGKELMEKAAIIFGPPMTRPDGGDICDKYHICVKCYEWLVKITIKKPVKKYRK